jgi:hypothetical protein
MPLSFREAGFCISGGADPLVGVPSGPGRPRPAVCVGTQSRSLRGDSGACNRRQAGQGAGCGPGGPPHNLCLSSKLGKLSDIGLKPAPPNSPPAPTSVYIQNSASDDKKGYQYLKLVVVFFRDSPRPSAGTTPPPADDLKRAGGVECRHLTVEGGFVPCRMLEAREGII